MSWVTQTRHCYNLTSKSLTIFATQKRYNVRESIHRYVEPDKFKKHMLAASEPYIRMKYNLKSDTCKGVNRKEHELHPLQQIYSNDLVEALGKNDFVLFIQHNYTPFQSERVYINTLIKSGGQFYSHRNEVYRSAFTRLDMDQRVHHLFNGRNSIVLGMAEKLPTCVNALKKMPQFILLGGCIDKQIYSNNQLQLIAKTPSLDLCRANLLSILETPAIDLASNLEEYSKIMDRTEGEN